MPSAAKIQTAAPQEEWELSVASRTLPVRGPSGRRECLLGKPDLAAH
jgi:hypothetical protein